MRRLLLIFMVACDDPTAGGQATTPDASPIVPTPFAIDVFGHDGHAFEFFVSEEQATAMEERGPEYDFEDEYDLGIDATYADDLFVTNNITGERRSFGKVELAIVGQSTRRPWNRIPVLRLDADEFQPGLRIGGAEHLRFNNGQVSGIYREAIALAIWDQLGYPAPRTTFAWVTAPNQWGDTVRVPYTVVEPYKRAFCERVFGEPGCTNIWETAGDVPALVGQCQLDECNDARLTSFVDLQFSVPLGPGYSAALSEYVDWDAWRSFQCLSWLTGTGDDYIHNTNNFVWLERADGKMQPLPYSTDISAGQQWYPDVPLIGHASLAVGCQTDPVCWASLLTRCDELLTDFESADLASTVVAPIIARLDAAGMKRQGDDARADFVQRWYSERVTSLRSDPIWEQTPCIDDASCANHPEGLTSCQGVCVLPWMNGCDNVLCPEGMVCIGNGECVFPPK